MEIHGSVCEALDVMETEKESSSNFG